MTSNIIIHFEDWEAERMKDPEFRAAVEELEPAYQAAWLRIRKRLWAIGQEGRSRALEYDGDPIEDLHHILPEDLSAEEWQSIISGAYGLKEQVLELEAEVHTLSTMLDCQWGEEKMDRHLRHKAQRALRCFASVLVSNDPKVYAKAFGWTPQRLRKLVDDMHPPSVDLQEGREETASDAAKQCCICGKELDALGICKALPHFSNPPPVNLGGIIGRQFLEARLKRLVETTQAIQELVMHGKLDREQMEKLWTQARVAREKMIALLGEETQDR